MSKKDRIKRETMPLYDVDRSYMRQITPIQAQQIIDGGAGAPMTADCSGELPGWKNRKNYPVHAVMLTVSAGQPTGKSFITRAEMEAHAFMVVNLLRSRTMNLSEEKRRERVARGLSEEDFAERAENKVEQWPQIYYYPNSVAYPRAVTVVPRP